MTLVIGFDRAMAWSWSHSPEAYQNAYDNLSVMSMRFLREAAMEWREVCGDELPPKAKGIPKDALVDFLWDKAEEIRTCDNGGFNAWVCPTGCHTVPFDLTPRAKRNSIRGDPFR